MRDPPGIDAIPRVDALGARARLAATRRRRRASSPVRTAKKQPGTSVRPPSLPDGPANPAPSPLPLRSRSRVLNQELPADEERDAALKRGLDAMYRSAQDKIATHFGRFAEGAGADIFAVPNELLNARDLAEDLPSCSAEEEAAIDDDLRMIRKRLAHFEALKMHCDKQSELLDAELEDFAVVAKQLKEGKENAGKTLGGDKENANACAAIVYAARQLQPLLEQAEAMQRKGNVFSADGFRIGDVSKTADPVVMAKSTLRAHFVKGGSLEVLKSINARLNAHKAATMQAAAAAAAAGGEAAAMVTE